MTVLWLIVWVLSGAPQLEPWNSWLVALGICLVIDVLGLAN